MKSPTLYGVILAGGAGERLWPSSRGSTPKHLLSVYGQGSLLQQTITRIQPMVADERIVIVTNVHHRNAVTQQVQSIAPAAVAQLLAEPVGRNTLPAITWAAAHIADRDPQALIVVVPSDHMIAQVPAFHAALQAASQLAQAGYLVTLGITPTAPMTGYGYIQAGARLSDAEPGYAVATFTEKPSQSTAAAYLRHGGYYWNAGIFVFRAEIFFEELQHYQPALCQTMQSWRGGPVPTPTDFARAYAALPALSMDHGLMEHTTRAAVIPVDIGWTDLGNWAAVYDIHCAGAHGNVTRGDVVAIDTENSLLFAEAGTISAVGMRDVIIVQHQDAVLVCARERAEDVKEVVEQLQGGPCARLTHTHPTEHRPWGRFTVLAEGPGYKVKRIEVDPAQRLSLQWHRHRAEHWVVAQGIAQVTRDTQKLTLQVGDHIDIPIGTKHRLANPGPTPLVIIETQLGPVLDENDIVRLEDQYGRR